MITGKRVLCAASYPNYGHAIPTASLALAFQQAGNDVAIVTDAKMHSAFYEALGLRCVNIVPEVSTAPEALAMMLALLEDFDPEITVGDFRRDLWLAQHVLPPRCRISIMRGEHLLGFPRLSPYLPELHTRISTDDIAFLQRFGYPPINDLRLLLRTEVVVIPSTPEFDPLTDEIRAQYPNSVLVYTGPLNVNGFDSAPSGLQSWAAEQRRAGRPVALVTTGTAWGTRFCLDFLESVDRLRFSCILAVPKLKRRSDLERYRRPHLFITEGVGLSELLPSCDVAIHHAGHGTMLLVVLASRPSITFPSFHWDREDNALRLEDLGCGLHLDDRLYRRGLNVEYLNDAVDRVCADGRMAAATAQLAARVSEFMARNGPAALLRTLEERRLVPSRPSTRRRPRSEYSPPAFPSLHIGMHALRNRLWRRTARADARRAGLEPRHA